MKKFKDLQMLFAAVTYSVGTLLTLALGKSFNLLSGYTETNSIHSATTANFVHENVNKK
jgi:hypothetical protein